MPPKKVHTMPSRKPLTTPLKPSKNEIACHMFGQPNPEEEIRLLRNYCTKLIANEEYYLRELAKYRQEPQQQRAHHKQIKDAVAQVSINQPHPVLLTTHRTHQESQAPTNAITKASQTLNDLLQSAPKPEKQNTTCMPPLPSPVKKTTDTQTQLPTKTTSLAKEGPTTHTTPSPCPPSRTSCKTGQPPQSIPEKFRSTRTTPTINAAVQFFRKPEPTNHRFQYLYLQCQQRTPRNEVRDYLRALDINPNRVLDISFPARHVVGLLLHVDYVTHVTQQLKQHKLVCLKNFNPIDPQHLQDPSYSSLPTTERQQVAIRCQRNRCLRALSSLHGRVLHAIASAFQSNGWLTNTDITHVLAKTTHIKI
ncbi:hypothetical protein O0I10_013307 [Lichtheimia ornata]|uniref:Uncharacterized protein n=1 Tax=Lichtheimia ornata TaxID=688661 RepID=A0AAD7XNY0_9FUNG|nr:uncharacterized protein O0I10_013307 [Lichtheimia ornata]KAJ8651229.1 hypothetical protein O0I10_013307 [Lichtheimia ornata]